MKLQTYFRVVGVLELFAVAGAIVWWIVQTVTSAYLSSGLSIGINILILILILLFGPAIGALFIAVAELLEERDEKKSSGAMYIVHQENKTSSLEHYESAKLYNNNFKAGDVVRILKDVEASSADSTIIKNNSAGRVVGVNGQRVIAVFVIAGREVKTTQKFDLFEKI